MAALSTPPRGPTAAPSYCRSARAPAPPGNRGATLSGWLRGSFLAGEPDRRAHRKPVGHVWWGLPAPLCARLCACRRRLAAHRQPGQPDHRLLPARQERRDDGSR
eukprot:scaffold142834_cov109-Phaeocystis_antarctica.AAC.1